MNKVFRVIWNHATQTWVAVSELAKAKGKTKSKTSKLTAFSVALGSTLAAGSVMAAISTTLTGTISQSSNGIAHLANGMNGVDISTESSVSAPKNIIVIGNKSSAVYDQDIYIGFNIHGNSAGQAGNTIIGNRVTEGGGTNGHDSFSTAVGFGTQVAGPSVAMGVGARADINSAGGWNATSSGGVAIGAFALQGGNIDGGTVIGALSSGDYYYATSIGTLSGITNTFIDRAIDKGYALTENGPATNIRIAQTSIGYKAGARGARAVAIGNCATTGVANTAYGIGAVAIGDQSKAFKDASIAIGQQAIAGGVTNTEITALNAEVKRIQGFLDQANANLAAAITKMNADKSADNKFNVAAAQAAVQRISLALERAKKDLTYASANNSKTTASVAIGYSAKSNNFYSTAVGPQSLANSANSTVLGRSASVSGANALSALAIGHDARVIGDSAVNATAIGTQSRIHHNATGAIAFGSNSNIYGDSSNSIAIGTNTNISDSRRVAANNAIAIGNETKATNLNAIAIGNSSQASGIDSIALGNSNNVTGNYSGAFGDPNTVTGNQSYAFGNNNTVKADQAFVLGNKVTVESTATDNRTGAVVLGDNSTVPTEVKAVNSAKIGTTDGKKLVYSGFAGNLGGSDTEGNPSKAAADKQGRFVSIGSNGNERQLKFVAAGEISATSTDAINGSQLYAFSGVVNNLATSTATIIGGGATLNQNGTINGFSRLLDTTGLTATTYTKPTTAATNVATAITNLNDYVNAGWKIAEGNDAAAKARISPNEQVNFKADGLASVTVTANGTGANVTYTVTKGEFKDTTDNGTISAKDDDNKGKAATVGDVSEAINRAYWKAKAAGNGADGNTITNDTPDQVTAGTEVTFEAGKNLTVDHSTAKTFTFATVDTPNFKGVELVNGNTAADKKLTLTPTNAGDLKLNKGTGNAAAKITNVVSGLEKFDENNPLINGHTLEELTMSQDPAYSGLTNLADKNVQNNTAATVGDLRGMGWVVSSNKTTDNLKQEYTAQVKNANEVKFVGTGVAVVSGKTDENTRTITVDVAKGTLVNASADVGSQDRGKVTVTNGDDNKVATVKNVADAINSTGTIIKANNEHDTAITDTDETKNDDGAIVKAGEEVTYTAGKNLRVKRDTRNLTFALANNITVNSANVSTKLTIGKTNPVGITSDANGLNFATTEGTNTNAPVYLNGIKSTLQDTLGAATPNLVGKTFTDAEKARAASVQDVLNSGWNIRGKKQATDADVANVDFVRTYDTVDFISGDANTTEVTVNAKDDNKRTEVSIKAKTGETDVVTAADTGKKAGQVKAKANAGTTTDQGSNLATVDAVANAVNRAYWTAKAAGNGADGNTITNDTPNQVTAGTEVTFEAGKNLAVTHTTNKFEFKTKDDVEFTSLQIGGTDGPKLTKDGDSLKVSTADGSPVKITNVKAGENDNDAVSYKQFKEIKVATDNTIKLTAIDNVKGTQNKTETTTSDQKLNQADGINFKLASADNDLLSVKAAGDTVTFTPKLGKVEVTNGKAVEATSQTGLVEATALTEALNKLGWKTKATEAGSTANPVDQEINAGDSVNYEDGQGTTAKVEITKGATNPDTGISTPDTVSVKYDVKAADNTINVSDAGVKVNTGSIELAKTDEKANDRGKVTITPKAKVDGGTETQEEANKRAETEVATVKNVANAINSAATIIKAHNDNTEITDEVKDDKGETVKAGDDVTYTAGKNLRVKRDARNLTFALANEIEVEKATATKSLTIGEGDNTTTLTSDEDGLSVAGKNDAPRKVTNVAEGTETLVFDKEGNQLVEIGGKFYDTADIDDQGLPKADAKEKTPLKDTDTDADAYAKAASGLADLAGSDQTNALTVADAGKLGWVMSAGGNSTAVQNADEVIFNAKDGVNITSHFDANSGKYNVDFGLKVDEDADNILNVTEDGVSVLKGELEAAATTGTTRGKVTVKEADQTGDNQVATVNNVAEAINSAKWFAKAENLEEALTDRAQKDTDEEAAAIGAGDLIALKADKNLAVKREGTNFTYGLAKDIGVNSITLGTAETAVNLSSSAGALNVADKDGNTAQITNVKAGAEVVTFDKDGNQIVKKGDKYVTLDDAGNPTNIEATPATEEELAKLDPSQKALAGLADLYGSKGTNALTVEDARNLGWVVSAGDHSAAVTNTDEVVFEGTNGVDVSAKSENGVHTITVGIAQGKVDGNTTTGVATGDTNYVTGEQVAKAINESGWKTNVTQTNATTGATEIVTKVVTPGTQVNYVNGSGTNANVSANASTGGLDVTFDVKSANTDTLTVDKDGVKVNTGKITAADSNATITIANADGTTSTIDNPERGKVTVGEDQGNKVATVQNVADAINSAKWFANAKNLDTAMTVRSEKGTESQAIGAGDTVTFQADKNLAVSRKEGVFTYGLAKDIGVNSVTLGTADTVVNLSSSAGALNVADKEGNAAQITNVKAGAEVVTFDKEGNQIVRKGDKYVTLDDAGHPTNIEATPATEEELAKLDPRQKALAGLADLYGSKGTNALTVEDARNLGWVVSAGDHSAAVTNTDEVVFEGINGVDVSAKSENGVHTITVGIKDGDVVKSNQFTAKVGGKDTPVIKVGDQYYKVEDIDPKTGAPKANVNAVTVDANTTPTNAGLGYVTGNKVADAIQQSGFVLGKQKAPLAASDYKDADVADEVVNPNDEVRFADGNNTKVKLATKESVDVTGNKVTTTTVKVDVNGLPVQYTTADGTPVTKVGDAFYKVDANGNPTGDVVDGTTLVAKVINPTAKANETGRSITLGNVANGAKTFDAAKDAEGNDLVKANDGLWHKATDVEANGTLKPKASSATPVTSDSSAGLVDFTKSKPNNVATVGDLQNIGWVMSTSDNGYTDQVRNANKVDFKGGNGIEVKGKTLTDGTREITVAIKEGDVTKSNEFTAPDGTKLTKIGDNYYRQEDIDIHTGKPKSSEVKALYKAEGDKVFAIDQVTGNIKPSEEAKLVKKDNGYVTGNKVADAIAQSGWNIGLGDDAKASEAFADPTKALSANTLEKVNPNDNLRFANGKNTKVSAATVESTDENGDKVTTTYVKTDVELPLSQLSATDAAGNKVVKGTDGKWYPAKADGSADTAKEAVDGRTVRQETVLDPDNKGEKYKALTEQPTSADNNAISRAQSDALKDQKVVDAKAQLAKTLAQAGQSAEVITAALEGIDNAVRDEVKAKYLKDNGLDKGTAGSVITNIAWGQKPSDAVNVDQLQNSGWNLDSKAVAGTNGKVTTINTAATKVKMDETVNINAGQNIEITRHGKSVEIATSMNPNFDSVKLGKGNKAVMLNSTADGALSVEGAKVTNVAKGRITSGSTDAINGGQLYDVASQVSQHLGNLNHRINKVGKNSDAGTASALAASQLPQAYIPGKSMVAVAGGTYQGQNGLALGVSRTSDNGKVIIRLSGTANSQGKKGVAAGIGYQW